MLISFPVVFLSLTDDFTATPVCLHRSEKCNSTHIIPLLLEFRHFWDSETFSTPSTIRYQCQQGEMCKKKKKCRQKQKWAGGEDLARAGRESKLVRWTGGNQEWASSPALAYIRIAEVFDNKTLVPLKQRGAVLLLIAMWPPGKGQEKNKNFLRGSLNKRECFFFSFVAAVVWEVEATLAAPPAV